VSVIKHFGVRGLAFKEEWEKFGLRNNGNYLEFFEVLAQFDSFLHNHIKTLRNSRSCHVSYLSKKICDEFMYLMYQNITKQIIREIKYIFLDICRFCSRYISYRSYFYSKICPWIRWTCWEVFEIYSTSWP